jgi:hypothetical protein
VNKLSGFVTMRPNAATSQRNSNKAGAKGAVRVQKRGDNQGSRWNHRGDHHEERTMDRQAGPAPKALEGVGGTDLGEVGLAF